MLRSNGHLALLWNEAPDLPDSHPFKKAFNLLLENYPEKRNEIKSKAERDYERKKEIINSDFFELEDCLEYSWKIIETRDSLTKGFFSQRFKWYMKYRRWVTLVKDSSLAITEFKFLNRDGEEIELENQANTVALADPSPVAV